MAWGTATGFLTCSKSNKTESEVTFYSDTGGQRPKLQKLYNSTDTLAPLTQCDSVRTIISHGLIRYPTKQTNKQTNKEYPLRIATSVVFKNPVHTWSSSFCCWEDSSRESFWGKFLSSSITCEGTTRYNMKPPRTWERIAQLFSKLTELARVWVCIFYSQATEL